MKQLHWTRKLKYMNAVADHLIGLGYQVEQPTHDDDYLDVWGTFKGRKCFQEIYVSVYDCGKGINGVWYQGDHDGIETYLDTTYGYGLDTRDGIETILDGLRPFKKGKLK